MEKPFIINHGSADSTSYIKNLCQAKAMPTNAKMGKQRTNQTQRKGSRININVSRTGKVTDRCRNSAILDKLRKIIQTTTHVYSQVCSELNHKLRHSYGKKQQSIGHVIHQKMIHKKFKDNDHIRHHPCRTISTVRMQLYLYYS